MYFMANKIFSKVNGVLSITQPVLDIALTKARRKQNELDKVIPLGYPKLIISNEELTAAQIFWKSYSLNPEKDFIICFFGQIGYQFDLETVIEGANGLQNTSIKFVICGKGDKLAYFQNKSQNSKNIIFPGLINAAQIQALMNISKLGLAPYIQPIFNNSLPNKIFEYMSAGLPIITSLHDGYLGKFLNEQEIGFTYKNSHDLVQQLVKLEEDQSVIVGKNKAIIDIFEKSFSAETVYHNYMKHLESVILNFKS
jgi:glycosyltransferase involved in cell wall biosynthesis